MKDNQKKYIEHIINDIVRDTNINYDKHEIHSHYPSSSFSPFHPSDPSLPNLPPFFFLKYCIDTYGLTEDEIKYVWDQYKGIILDKIRNER